MLGRKNIDSLRRSLGKIKRTQHRLKERSFVECASSFRLSARQSQLRAGEEAVVGNQAEQLR